MSAPSLSRRRALVLISSSLASTSLSACDLIFEPPAKAADRFLQAIATGNRSKIDEFIERAEDRDTLRKNILEMEAAFGGTVFKGKTDYWTVGTPIEDTSTEIFDVPVTIHVPRNPRRASISSRKSIDVDIHLVMQELRLRWYVLDAKKVYKLLRQVKRSR